MVTYTHLECANRFVKIESFDHILDVFYLKIVKQDLRFCFQGILINGQFPGPDIHSVTNDNLIINVHNSLPEPFLISWLALL